MRAILRPLWWLAPHRRVESDRVTRKWLWLILFGFILATPLLARLLTGRAAQSVEGQHPAYRILTTSILASGNFVYDGQVELSSQVIGRVIGIGVHEGDPVRAGQTMLQIDNDVYKAARDQQTANYNIQKQHNVGQREIVTSEQNRFARVATLSDRGFVTKQQVEDAKRALVAAETGLRATELSVDQARAALDQSDRELDKTTIRSPIDGFVTSLNIKTGEIAVPSTIGIQGAPLVTIARYGSLLLELNVGEADVARVRPGQTVAIHPVAYPNATLHGRVDSISLTQRRPQGALPVQNDTGRAYTVKVTFKSPPGVSLRSSMTCRAEIFINGAKRLLSLPLQSVFTDDENGAEGGSGSPQSYVLVASAGIVSRRDVTLGASDDAFVEIRSGVNSRDTVLTGPYKLIKFLRGGEAVKTIVRNEPT
jgi:HlyD family secretion protein